MIDRITTLTTTVARGVVVIGGILLFPLVLGLQRAKIVSHRLRESVSST